MSYLDREPKPIFHISTRIQREKQKKKMLNLQLRVMLKKLKIFQF